MIERILAVRDPGSMWVEPLQDVYYKPFEAATGIRIRQMAGGQEPTELIRDQVARQDYAWDVVMSSQAANHAATLGTVALEEIDLDTPGIAAMPVGRRSAFFLGDNIYSKILAWNADAFPQGSPQDWRDLWNIAQFPGRRSVRAFPMDVLEFALLADGVAPDALYPLDADRAFAKLDVLRAHVDIWWRAGDEQQRLLAENRVDLCAVTNLRAVEAMMGGAKVGYGWGRNLRTLEGWGILKGTPRLDLAREFLRFVVDPERQAALAERVAVSPAIPAANALISVARRPFLPDTHLASAIETDWAYWATAKAPLAERFEAWLTQG